MRFTGAAGAIYFIEASTNLVDWETIGAGAEPAAGSFEFEDTKAGKFLYRFYRVRAP